MAFELPTPLDLELKAIRWTRETPGGWSSARPYLWSECVLVGGQRGTLAAYSRAGTEEWLDTVGNLMSHSELLEKLFARDFDGLDGETARAPRQSILGAILFVFLVFVVATRSSSGRPSFSGRLLLRRS